MASELQMRIKSDKTLTQLKADILRPSGDKSQAQAIEQLLQAAQGGLASITIEIDVDPAKASGTVTCASVQAADTVTIDGVVLTAVSGTPAADEFDISGTNTAAAASLVAAINANATLDGRVTATSALGVVTVQADQYGEDGNSVSLASSDGTRLAVSGAALSGGDNGTTRSYAFNR
jgi:phage tail sheath gpL-like